MLHQILRIFYPSVFLESHIMNKNYFENAKVVYKEDLGWASTCGKNGTAILLHGSHATPVNNESLANKLTKKGYKIISPLLQGHGLGHSYPQTSANELIDQISTHIRDVKKNNDYCIVIGSSMGGTLALLSGLLEITPDLIVTISGALSCSSIEHPWVHVLNDLKIRLAHHIHFIKTPTLIFHDIDDTTVFPKDADEIMKSCGCDRKKCIYYSGSGHSLMFSNHAEEIVSDIENFRSFVAKKKKTKLIYNGKAKEIYLAGEFSNWQQSFKFTKCNDTLFELEIFLRPGIYSYKLVVDGDWILDPNADISIAPNGQKNSTLIVTT